MSPTLRELGSVRSAAVVNAEIRALWARSGARLSAADEAKYQRLLVEWAAAVGPASAEGVEPAPLAEGTARASLAEAA
ncbi:hypothetical protein ABZ729_15080 [Streptomyces sp. NPDC006678]|uniref:hypothetical protein n=1 Tax=Streptomyces sp. NPDC006678 TaxID=3157185 RepID=UPI003400F1B0